MDDHPMSMEMTDLVRRLHACHRLLKSCMETALSDLEMTDTELLVLGACQSDTQRPVAQGSIVSFIGLSPAQLSALVERLRQRGWLEVRRAPGDRRKQLLCPTPAGTMQLRIAQERLAQFTRELSSRWSPDQQDSLLRGLDQLADFCQRASSLPAPTTTRQGEAA